MLINRTGKTFALCLITRKSSRGPNVHVKEMNPVAGIERFRLKNREWEPAYVTYIYSRHMTRLHRWLGFIGQFVLSLGK